MFAKKERSFLRALVKNTSVLKDLVDSSIGEGIVQFILNFLICGLRAATYKA
jgi:hypothetical protein